jgi:hypothetical protein
MSEMSCNPDFGGGGEGGFGGDRALGLGVYFFFARGTDIRTFGLFVLSPVNFTLAPLAPP